MNKESAWYGGAHWFLYQFTDKVQGVWRAEIFRDNNGAATGSADNLLRDDPGGRLQAEALALDPPRGPVRPGRSTTPFNDGTRSSQLTLAFDIIVQF